MDSIFFSTLPSWGSLRPVSSPCPAVVKQGPQGLPHWVVKKMKWVCKRRVLVELWGSLGRRCTDEGETRGHPPKQSWGCFTLSLGSAKASSLPVKWTCEACVEWRQPVVGSSGLRLHTQLTPAPLCYPEEKAKGVNEEMSGRHVGAFRTTPSCYTHVVLDVENCRGRFMSRSVVFVISHKDFSQSPFKKKSCWVCLRKWA